jgi:hypothetical protein
MRGTHVECDMSDRLVSKTRHDATLQVRPGPGPAASKQRDKAMRKKKQEKKSTHTQ